MRLGRKKRNCVGIPGGKVSASIKNPSASVLVARSDGEIRGFPDGTVVEWPRDVERMNELRGGSGITFRIDEVDTPCGCGHPCAVAIPALQGSVETRKKESSAPPRLAVKCQLPVVSV
ncbi:hypothetical protein P3T76_001963 [Phytophthora citrophthora]|uniref:Uncharacterized protein n=1 Tax=Phytophthora citrophthora TaxID=4793 RepID=A0AAD9GXM6_9STRA|nr:hypothetical protein P3T76_001963 [Phytophthora citrophthora]